MSHKIRVKTASSERGHHPREEVGSVPGEGNGSKTPRAKMATASPSKRDTVVNISNEGTENETQLGSVEETLHRMGFNDVTRLTMNPLLDRAPPPPYQDFYPPSAPTHPMHPILPSTQVLPSVIYSSLPSRSSPPPSYSQIDLSSPHFPSATPHLPSRHGGPSSQNPYQLGPGGRPTSHLPSQLGGARPKKLQQTNQQLTNKQMAASLRRAGLTNGERIVNVRQKEEEEQEQVTVGKVVVAIFIFIFLCIFEVWLACS